MEDELSKRDRKKLNKEKGQESSTNNSSIVNKLLIVIVLVLAAALVFWMFYRSKGSGEAPKAEVSSPAEINSQDHIKGNENGELVLVEYGDFQCPACAAYQPVLSQIADEFKDNIKIVYRHFPLRTIHRHAQMASQASEAANQQGKFWEMHDLLYAKQTEWSNVRDPRSLFKEYAQDLGLNVEEFDMYMNSSEAAERVNADYASANAAGINSTPSFFINGEKIESPQGLEPFRQIILAKLEELKDNDSNEESEATNEGEIKPQL